MPVTCSRRRAPQLPLRVCVGSRLGAPDADELDEARGLVLDDAAAPSISMPESFATVSSPFSSSFESVSAAAASLFLDPLIEHALAQLGPDALAARVFSPTSPTIAAAPTAHVHFPTHGAHPQIHLFSQSKVNLDIRSIISFQTPVRHEPATRHHAHAEQHHYVLNHQWSHWVRPEPCDPASPPTLI